jgi:hypothetical protein
LSRPGTFDADTFFVTLAKKLGAFPPALFAEPMKHLQQILTVVNPFNFPGHGKDLRELAENQASHATRLLEAENGQRAAARLEQERETGVEEMTANSPAPTFYEVLSR